MPEPPAPTGWPTLRAHLRRHWRAYGLGVLFLAVLDGIDAVAMPWLQGAAFANRYCWVCRFEGDLVVEVRAYLDSMMVAYTILRNELEAQG